MKTLNKFLPKAEFDLRMGKIRKAMAKNNLDAVVLSTNVSLYYATGHILAGYVYIPLNGKTWIFVRRPLGIETENVVYIKKPEQIPALLEERGIAKAESISYEMGRANYLDVMRLGKVFGVEKYSDCTALMNEVRSVKTEWEVKKLRESGVRHVMAYRRFSGIYKEGMTDSEYQIELERILRLDGCLGQFRIAGDSMELFMGSLLAGDNADTPSPYDFAMGGEGMDSSLPVGCNGSIIHPGNTVMVDMNGNFTGYMTDMTRSYYVNRLDPRAKEAHKLSIAIHKALIDFIKPGVGAKDAYDLAYKMVEEAGFADNFMGHTQKAGFVGHGVGIEVNEWPVLAPRSKQVFEAGNVIAIEPKFVIPGVGAVGIENTYLVTEKGLDNLTPLEEEIVEL